LVAREAFALAVDREHRIAVAGQAAVGADPQVPLTVLEEAADGVAVGAVARGGEALAIVPRKSGIRARPDVAVAVLPKGPNKGIGQAVALGDTPDPAVHRALTEAQIAAEPQVPAAVDDHRSDEHAAESRGRNYRDEAGGSPFAHGVEAGDPEIAVPVLAE